MGIAKALWRGLLLWFILSFLFGLFLRSQLEERPIYIGHKTGSEALPLHIIDTGTFVFQAG